jgi:uncharacterized protein (UPF0264 family)
MFEAPSSSRSIRLLVSVRNATEAGLAAACGADIIDVKEPSRGSLGAAEPSVVEEIVGQWGHRALGEMIGWSVDAPLATRWRRLASQWAGKGLTFLKVGLSASAAGDWRAGWARAVSWQPPEIARVAVVYADWHRARSPAPAAVLSEACELGCRAVLIDTHAKDRGTVLDIWTVDELDRWIARIHRCGAVAVVAGSLSGDQFPLVARLRPDVVAVRGAACRGGRTGQLCGKRLRALIDRLEQACRRERRAKCGP